MPVLTTDPPSRGIIHYEVYGKGRPVLFLHGWLGSWQLWRNTITQVGEHYRTYSVDFYGFGESRAAGKKDEAIQDFKVETFVNMVGQFMDKMGIPKAAVIGHSMGGTVAMQSAIQYPDRVVKACAIGSPIDGRSLYLMLKLGGNPTLAKLGYVLYPVLHSIIGTYMRFVSGPETRQMVLNDMNNATMQSFFESINSLHHTDLSPNLPSIQQPLMGIYGKKDIIVGHKQVHLMQKLVPHAVTHLYPDAGHFPMMDTPDKFIGHILDFLEKR